MNIQETEPEFDWTSGYPSRHLSFIVSQILPQRCILGDVVQAEISLLAQENISNITVEHCGGPFDGYIIPKHKHRFKGTIQELNNFDTYIIPEQYSLEIGGNAENNAEIASNKSYDFTIDTAETRPGYVRIKVNNPKLKELSIHVQGQNYLSAVAVRKHIGSIIHCNTEKVNLALPCAQWPKEFEKWQKRQRRSEWPDENTIKEICNETVMVIPSNSESSFSNDTEWCFSFAKVQSKLFNKLNQFQRQCFALIKLLHTQSLIFPKILSDDHLKTMFLWICEKIPQDEWNFENLGTFFVYSIDYILECIINKEIMHYFMSHWNLLDNLADDFQDDLMTTIANLRTSPIEPFYTYLSLFQFEHLPQKCLKLLFEDIEKEKAFDTNQSILQKQYNCLKKMTAEFITDCKFQLALDIQSDFNIQLNVQHNPCSFLSSMSLEAGTDTTIAIHEFLLDKFPNSCQRYMLLGNLGCMYHVKYATTCTESEKISLQKKAAITFDKAIACEGVTSATKTDFCNFLFHTKKYEEVLALSTDVLQEASNDGNSYGGDERNTVDDNIQTMIAEYGGNVLLWSYGYTYYLKVQSFRMLHKNEDAISSLSEFSTACSKLQDERYIETAYLLLGFASKDMERYGEARKAFRQVEKMNPRIALATENKDECTGILMSMHPDTILEDDSDVENAGNENKSIPPDKCFNLKSLHIKDTSHMTNIPSINEAHALHRQYALLIVEKEKAELKEKTQAQYKIALSDGLAPAVSKMSYVNFLYHTGKYDQALGIIEEILESESRKNGKDLEMIWYTFEDIPIVDANLVTMIKDHGGGLQLVVYTYAFYIMVKCLQQQGKYLKATDLLPDFHQACDRISNSLQTCHTISNLTILGYAAKDVRDYDCAVEVFDQILKLQPNNQMAKQYRDQCEDDSDIGLQKIAVPNASHMQSIVQNAVHEVSSGLTSDKQAITQS